jgi:hypothetical protein
MLALSDDELAAVMNAAAPLDRDLSAAFVEAVAAELAKISETGPGVVHRICAATQRQFFTPPQFQHAPGRASKYR